MSTATYAPGGSYTLSGITYDKNGNIKTLARNGIDNLEYDYIGNRLNYVKDAALNTDGFKDNMGGGTGQDYTFWDDGSLKSDRNKGIFQIDYDTYLKKVSKISFNSTFTDFVKFYYSGDGTLIRRESSIANNKWDYTDGVIYKNEVPYQMNTAEGRAVYNGTDWEYEFEYRDHLGNLRSSFKNVAGIVAEVQTSETDPWGLTIPALSSSGVNPQNYRFQNQENIQDFGLNINWFKYRPFDPAIGKGWQVDRLSSDYAHNSPYAFSENKVTGHIELDGLEAVPAIPSSILWSQAGFTGGEQSNIKMVKDAAIGAGKTLAMMALMAIPFEELAVAGIGLIAKEVGIVIKAESALIKTESTFVKEASTTQKTTITEQAESLVSANSGKNRVSLRSEKSQVDVDLRGDPHFDKKTNTTFDTPHTKTSPRNTQAPENQGIRYNTSEKHAEYRNSNQQDIRTVRRYLKKQ